MTDSARSGAHTNRPWLSENSTASGCGEVHCMNDGPWGTVKGRPYRTDHTTICGENTTSHDATIPAAAAAREDHARGDRATSISGMRMKIASCQRISATAPASAPRIDARTAERSARHLSHVEKNNADVSMDAECE